MRCVFNVFVSCSAIYLYRRGVCYILYTHTYIDIGVSRVFFSNVFVSCSAIYLDRQTPGGGEIGVSCSAM